MNDTIMRDYVRHAEALAIGPIGSMMVDAVGGGLQWMMDNQRIVSSGVDGCVPAQGEPPSKENLRNYFLATIVELTELLQEFNWKPWKNGPLTYNEDKVVEEFADVLAFLGVLLLQFEALGISTTALADAYRQKSITNIVRMVDTYCERPFDPLTNGFVEGVNNDHID